MCRSDKLGMARPGRLARSWRYGRTGYVEGLGLFVCVACIGDVLMHDGSSFMFLMMAFERSYLKL